MATPLHPKLIEAAAAEFAAASQPLPTSTISVRLTHHMRNVVTDTPDLTEADVMADAGAYYEVPSSWVPRIAKAVGAVEMAAKVHTKGRRYERGWALPAKLAEWAQARTAAAAEREQAAERVRVIYLGSALVVLLDGATVADFYPDTLGAELASEHAEDLAHKLRRSLVAAG